MIDTTDLNRSYAEHERTIATANTEGGTMIRQASRQRPAGPVTVAPVLFRVRHWLAPPPGSWTRKHPERRRRTP